MKSFELNNPRQGLVKKVLCFGEVLWDLLPEGRKVGGAPVNVALHLKRFGIDARFAGRIGNDALGNELRIYLENKGLDTGLIQVDYELPTSTVEVHLGLNNYVNFEIKNNVAWDRIELSKSLEKAADETDLIIYGTLSARQTISRMTLLSLLNRNNCIKLIDVNLRAPYNKKEIVEELLKNADIVKLNDTEIKYIAEWYGKKYSEKDLTKWISEKFNCGIVCLTRGANGALINHLGELLEHQGFKVEVKDTVGSGDAFLAGFVASYFSGQPLYTALEYACAVGALVATKSGGTPDYSTDEISKILQMRSPIQ